MQDTHASSTTLEDDKQEDEIKQGKQWHQRLQTLKDIIENKQGC